jgi:16S rRNA (guanine527-N7)-methyltransferase
VKHRDQLREYCRLLLGSSINLTSVKDPVKAWELHVEDALTAIPAIEARAPESIVDVGSGGGSPGIPVVVETGIPTTLLESRERKSEFLQEVVDALGIDCSVVAERSEVFARGAGRDAFGLAVARALAPPPVATELCLPLVRVGGWMILWAARGTDAAVASVAPLLGGRLADVIDASDGRCLLVVDKISPTPDAYPRRAGVAGKRPLA